MGLRLMVDRGIDMLDEAYMQVIRGECLDDERKMLQFLQEKEPELAVEWEKRLEDGRRTVLNHVAAAMLREDILGLWSESADLRVMDGFYAWNRVRSESEKKWIKSLYGLDLDASCPYKIYSLHREEWLVIPIGQQFAFRRVEVGGTIWHVQRNQVKPLRHAIELLFLLRYKEISQYGKVKHHWIKLAEELINASANQTLSHAFWARKKERFLQEAPWHANLIDWVEAKKKEDRSFDASLFFEQFCVDGHHLHPGAKTKMGMSPEAIYRYSPELENEPSLRFVAVHRSVGRASLFDGETEANRLLFAQFPELEGAARKSLGVKGESLNDYLLFPVHVWQMENALSEIYAEELHQGLLIPIADYEVPAVATSSFRTVQPKRENGMEPWAVKVAVNSQMTSTVRSISPQTAHNAPLFTRLIQEVMRREVNLNATFVPVCEWAGLYYEAERASKEKLRNLSVVFRDAVENVVKKDEMAIVGTALYAESPFSGRSILSDLIERFAKTTGEDSLKNAAIRFVSEYARVALPGFLTLMVKYGIGLEGHLQNSLPVFKEGRPVRMLFRDWGGARIYRPRLERQGLSVSFYPGSVTLVDEPEEMWNKVFYTVYQSHMGELIAQTAKAVGVQEERLWREVAEVSHDVLDQLAKEPCYREQASLDRKRLFAANVDHKALTKMRISMGQSGYCYSSVPNPLHSFAEGGNKKQR